MDDKNKLYDTILTEGARWLQYNRTKGKCLCAKDAHLDAQYKCFLEIARSYAIYVGDFAIDCPLWKYLYLKYIKKYKFLKRPQSTDIYYINVSQFLDELADFFGRPITIFTDIYNHYYRR